MKRLLGHLFRFGLGAAALAYVLWDIDYAALGAAIAEYDPWRVLLVLAFSLAIYGVVGFRLFLLSHGKTSTWVGTEASFVCHGVNNLLPTKLGEVAKALFMNLRGGISKTEALGVVFWERFLDLNALLLLAVGVLYLADLHLVVTPVAAGVLGLWGVILTFSRWPRLADLLIGLVPIERARELLRELHEHVNTRLDWGFLLKNWVLTLGLWMLFAVQALLVLGWVADLPLDLSQAVVVFVVFSAGWAIPSTPGGLGVLEALIVMALGWYGVPKEAALTAAITLHMLEYIPSVLLTVFILGRAHLSLASIRTAA